MSPLFALKTNGSIVRPNKRNRNYNMIEIVELNAIKNTMKHLKDLDSIE